jgi:hypothetical protein
VDTACCASSYWLLFRYSREMGTPLSERVFTYFVAVLAGIAPWVLFVWLLRQTPVEAFWLYLAGAGLGVLISSTLRTVRYPRTHIHFTPRLYYRFLKRIRPSVADVWENEQAVWRHQHTPGWLAVAGSLSLVILYVYMMLTQFVHSAYPSIPEQFGGGRPRYVQVLIAADARQGVQELGVPLLGSTINLSLLFEGSNFFLFETDDGVVVRLDKADVLGMRLDENISNAPYDYYPFWDVDLRKCRNEPPSTVQGRWDFTSSLSLLFEPFITAGRKLTLSIRNASGGAKYKESVRLTIVQPETDTREYREAVSAVKTVQSNEWTTFKVPQDLRRMSGLQDSGVYTVVWSSRAGFIGCSGFYVD